MRRPVVDAFIGGWQMAGINTFYAGETVTLTYTPGAAFQVSGIQQDFRGANNYRPNVIGEVMVPEDQRNVQNWFSRAGVVAPTDPSQPFGNAPRNAYRGPTVWQVDFAASKRFRCRGAAATSSSAPSSSTCSIARTSDRRTATSAPRRSGRSRRRTIHGLFSSV